MKKNLKLILCMLGIYMLTAMTPFTPSKDKPYKDYVGKYKLVMDPKIIITIMEDEGKLRTQISLNGDTKYDLVPLKGRKETFERMDGGKSVSKFTFFRNSEGAVTHLTFVEGGQFRANKVTE